MELSTFLKEHNARLDYEDRWLVWADAWCKWLVYQTPFNKHPRRIYEGDSLEEAIRILSGEDYET